MTKQQLYLANCAGTYKNLGTTLAAAIEVEELPPQKKGGHSSSGKDPERLRRFPEKQNVCLDPLLKEWDCGKQPVQNRKKNLP